MDPFADDYNRSKSIYFPNSLKTDFAKQFRDSQMFVIFSFKVMKNTKFMKMKNLMMVI